MIKTRRQTTIAMNVLKLSQALLVFALILPGVALAKYHLIARLDCPDGEFVMDARPYNPTLAGIAWLDIRYRYRGTRLVAIPYAAYHEQVQNYLHQVEPNLRNLNGYTLYFPPAQFSADEVSRVASCLFDNKELLKQASDKDIEGRFLLGLITAGSNAKNHKPYQFAFVINEESPIVDIYGDSHLAIIIERSARVMLLVNPYEKDIPAELFTWGKVLPPRFIFGKPRLELLPITFRGKTYDSEFARRMGRGRHRYSIVDKRTLNNKYRVVSP